MANDLISNINVVRTLAPSTAQKRPSSDTSLQNNLISAGMLKNKGKGKGLSKNIDAVLNKLSNKVSEDKEKTKDSAVVAVIKQDIGSILKAAKNNPEAKAKLSQLAISISSDNPQEKTIIVDAEEIIDVLNIASDVLDLQTEEGSDDSSTLSFISDLLGMLESLMGITDTGMQNGTAYHSQDRFNLLIEYISLVRDDLIEMGEGRFSDVINLVDQQLEERRYRDRESMKGFSQLDYLRRKGGRG